MTNHIHHELPAAAFDQAWAEELYRTCFALLQESNVRELSRVRDDLFTWRRGSAQMVLKVNPALNNLSIYSVLAREVKSSLQLYRHLLTYNILQRRETLGLYEKEGWSFVVMKYTMELELAQPEVLQRHIYAFQETADQLDTELVRNFGGRLKFEDWDKMGQADVDNLLEDMFG